MEDYLEKLNRQQLEAVTYLDGPELVIAGAGSGKTRVLTYKIAYLLQNGFEPFRIMALTFTNKAAKEMRERIDAMLGTARAGKIVMGTFHSVFARILRANADRIGFKSSFTIYDTSDSKALIKMLIKDMGLDSKIYTVSAVLSAISSAKNALVSPDRYAASADVMEADRRAKQPRMYELYARYMARCKVSNAMDFDDLLFYTHKLFMDHEDIRAQYREIFRYVLVDEYQDTNFAQHSIVAQLTEGKGNLCVVGDDAQSIYSFRGASIRNILDLNKFYPDLKIFKLEQNYRSTKNIINVANSLIEKNTEQIHKEVFSENGSGSKVKLMSCSTDREESRDVVADIFRRKRSTGESYNEFAILYRTNAQSRIFEEDLRNRNIPYRIWGGLSFYQRKEVKDVLAYLRLAVNNDDDESLRRVINYPARGIGDTTLGRVATAAIAAGVSLWEVIRNPDLYHTDIKSAALKKLGKFASLVEKMNMIATSQHDAYEAADKIITLSGIPAEFVSDHTPENVSRAENIAELLNSVRQYVDDASDADNSAAELSLAGFLSQASLATDQDSDPESSERVTLMTVHAAKGLEFKNVYVVGVEDDLFPSAMSKDSYSGIEEERRLLYVAITRAKEYCMLSHAQFRYRNGQVYYPRRSPFIRDIGDRLFDKVGFSERDDIYVATDRNQRSRNITPNGTQPSWVAPSVAHNNSSNTNPAFRLHNYRELSEGMKIRHIAFGEGLIESVIGDDSLAKIVVNFTSSGKKTLLLSFARFEIIDNE